MAQVINIRITWCAFEETRGRARTTTAGFPILRSEGTTDIDLLDHLFRDTNLYTGTLWERIEKVLPENRTHTALSVGDIVTIDGKAYRCSDWYGWEPLETVLVDSKACVHGDECDCWIMAVAHGDESDNAACEGDGTRYCYDEPTHLNGDTGACCAHAKACDCEEKRATLADLEDINLALIMLARHEWKATSDTKSADNATRALNSIAKRLGLVVVDA